MMKIFVLTMATLLFHLTAQAQYIEKSTVKGPEVFKFISEKGYKYRSFRFGKVYFTDSDSGGGRLNYNYLLQTMQFLGDKGDTLVFEDETKIKYITIGADTFYHDDFFFEKIAEAPGIKIAKRQFLKVNEPEKLGAFGKSTVTTSVVGVDIIRGFGSPLALDMNEEFRFVEQTDFFISVNNKKYTELNKKNINRLFPDKAGQVSEFIQANHLSFHKEQDIMSLVTYLNKLI